jgi:hypothetical protein
MRSILERSNAGAIWSAFRYASRRLVRRAKPAKAGIASLMLIAAAALCGAQQAGAQVTYNYTGNEMFQDPGLPNAGTPDGIITATATFNISQAYTGSQSLHHLR